MSDTISALYHVREEVVPVGGHIAPGRWGSTIVNAGSTHPFFFREHLLEIWRRQYAKAKVSRLNCTYAYESLHVAQSWRGNGHVHRVVPVTQAAPFFRADFLWLTWMGQPKATTEQVADWCNAYWDGISTATRMPNAGLEWEWLFACPLQVVEVL